MGYPQPADPIGGDAGWANYKFFLVSYTSRQGTPMTCTYYASSGAEAISFLNSDLGKVSMFGPFTGISATTTNVTG